MKGESKIKPPADAEENSVPSHNRRSEVGYPGEVRAGLGSVPLDDLPVKPTKRDKKIEKNPSIA